MTDDFLYCSRTVLHYKYVELLICLGLVVYHSCSYSFSLRRYRIKIQVILIKKETFIYGYIRFEFSLVNFCPFNLISFPFRHPAPTLCPPRPCLSLPPRPDTATHAVPSVLDRAPVVLFSCLFIRVPAACVASSYTFGGSEYRG